MVSPVSSTPDYSTQPTQTSSTSTSQGVNSVDYSSVWQQFDQQSANYCEDDLKTQEQQEKENDDTNFPETCG